MKKNDRIDVACYKIEFLRREGNVEHAELVYDKQFKMTQVSVSSCLQPTVKIHLSTNFDSFRFFPNSFLKPFKQIILNFSLFNSSNRTHKNISTSFRSEIKKKFPKLMKLVSSTEKFLPVRIV